MKSINEFVVNNGEKFHIHISGSAPSFADPVGLIGGTTYEFVANDGRLILERSYTTSFAPNTNVLDKVYF